MVVGATADERGILISLKGLPLQRITSYSLAGRRKVANVAKEGFLLIILCNIVDLSPLVSSDSARSSGRASSDRKVQEKGYQSGAC